MGLSDIEIEIDSCCLKAKQERTKSVRKRTTSSTKTNAASTSTDLELYKATGEDSIQKFNHVIQQISIKKQLPERAVFHQCKPLGNTLLHLASKFGNETTVSHLIRRDPSLLNKKNLRDDTALHIAARFGHKGIAEALVRFQGDLIRKSLSENGGSIVGEESRGIEMLEGYETHDMISNKYPLVGLQNAKGNTPLHEAIVYRREEVVSYLINLDQKVWFHLNNEKKSPLYLAVEAEFQSAVEVMLSHPVARENFDMLCKGKSPIHAAIRAKNEDILDTLLKKEQRFIHVRNQERMSPLQFAVSMGHLNKVRILLAFDPTTAIKPHRDGSFPIHMASMKGRDDIIQELLPYYPDHPMDILDQYGRNLLHIAAENGKCNVVRYILKNSQLQTLVNERDNDGNTHLHLATKHWHPKIVSALSWYKGIDVNSTNSDGCTALDIAEKSMERSASVRKRLTWTALKAAGASRCLFDNVPNGVERRTLFSTEIKSIEQHKGKDGTLDLDTIDVDKYKERVNTLLLVSILVATVTFAAGFTMPGGYNNSEPDQGLATMLRKSKFHWFILCDTIALYSSILVAVILIWAQLGHFKLVLNALKLALPLLGISLTTMCLAFTVGVSLVVGKLKWLNIVVLVMDLVFIVTITMSLFLLFLPVSSSSNCILRYMSYYPYCLLLLATGTSNEDLYDFGTLPNNTGTLQNSLISIRSAPSLSLGVLNGKRNFDCI